MTQRKPETYAVYIQALELADDARKLSENILNTITRLTSQEPPPEKLTGIKMNAASDKGIDLGDGRWMCKRCGYVHINRPYGSNCYCEGKPAPLSMMDRGHWEKSLRQALDIHSCSVCGGDPNVENCICGGVGTEQAEMDGLRDECHRQRDIIRTIEAQVDKIRYSNADYEYFTPLIELLDMFDPDSGEFNE